MWKADGKDPDQTAHAHAQSDQGLHCPLTESLATIEGMNGQRPRQYFAHAQDDLNRCIFRVFEGSVSLDEAQLELNTCQSLEINVIKL